METNIKTFQKYFDKKILNIRNLEHKGNNQLFAISLDNGEKLLLKRYSRIHMNDWERGKTEFKAINYLWEKGFREIPQPISFDEQENTGIYSFEEGRILKPEEITEKEIQKAVDFLVKVHKLGTEAKKAFGPASSACLNLREYINVLDRRLSKIIDYKPEEDSGEKARKFLDEKVIPKIDKLKKEFLEAAKNLDIDKELAINEQVLTPADFGFHNILVNENREFKFLDFEYFGRDDPARQILDFIHHAQSANIDEKLKKYFIEQYNTKIGFSDDFEKRINLLESLIAITWVLIYLNILSKKQIEHVKFAQGNVDNIIEERLQKAEKKLEEIK